jgi:hypothetical protein
VCRGYGYGIYALRKIAGILGLLNLRQVLFRDVIPCKGIQTMMSSDLFSVFKAQEIWETEIYFTL